jgi:uncharacterized protein (TIGR03000 family)
MESAFILPHPGGQAPAPQTAVPACWVGLTWRAAAPQGVIPMSHTRFLPLAAPLLAAAALLFAAGAADAGGGGHGGGGHGGGGHGGGHGGGGHAGGFHGGAVHGGFNHHHGTGVFIGVGGFGYGGYGYGGYGYGRGYGYYPYADYGADYYAAPYVAPAAPYYAMPPAVDYADRGLAPDSSSADPTAHVRVRVPAGAEVWFGQGKTQQTGAVREFVSPALTPGKEYTYDIKARWTEGGQEVVRTQRLDVAAGAWKTVDFTRPPAEQLEAPKPK